MAFFNLFKGKKPAPDPAYSLTSVSPGPSGSGILSRDGFRAVSTDSDEYRKAVAASAVASLRRESGILMERRYIALLAYLETTEDFTVEELAAFPKVSESAPVSDFNANGDIQIWCGETVLSWMRQHFAAALSIPGKGYEPVRESELADVLREDAQRLNREDRSRYRVSEMLRRHGRFFDKWPNRFFDEHYAAIFALERAILMFDAKGDSNYVHSLVDSAVELLEIAADKIGATAELPAERDTSRDVISVTSGRGPPMLDDRE